MIGNISARRYDAVLEDVRELALQVVEGTSNAVLVERLLEAAESALADANLAALIEDRFRRQRPNSESLSECNCLMMTISSRTTITTVEVEPRQYAADGTSRRIAGENEARIFTYDPGALDPTLGSARTSLQRSTSLGLPDRIHAQGRRMARALLSIGAIEESTLTDFLSRQYGLPAINLKDFDVPPNIIRLVPGDVALKHLAVPVNRAGPALIVAMCDPSNRDAMDDLKSLTGFDIEPIVASEPSIRAAIDRYYRGATDVSGPELFEALHLGVFARALDRATETVSSSQEWRALTRTPFTFLGRWMVWEGGSGQLTTDWVLRRVA